MFLLTLIFIEKLYFFLSSSYKGCYNGGKSSTFFYFKFIGYEYFYYYYYYYC